MFTYIHPPLVHIWCCALNFRKRFERAEAEYIASKMELYKWSEQKELLSNHLCAVIQQNESRKAEKLSELLKSLQLESEKQGTSRQTDC